ncbi:MAG TPA: protein kinase [Vicinamibacterales bacterium]|nr:protein kinase [Vicinamibacterales bacterium]
MPLIPGTKIGPYEVLALIGVGGMGEVYRARDTRLKRHVALKVLPDSLTADPARVDRFQREAEALATLNHPNIAQIYGLEGQALVLELVDGSTLEGKRCSSDEAISIASKVAEALEAAHASGIIHRDLKPANIKLRDDGVVKVLDFGLAKALDGPAEVTIQATHAGTIVGTAAYMSPEQAQGLAVDARADIFSFGATIYELVGGRRAFGGDSLAEVLAAVMRDEPAALPPPLGPILAKCLAKRAADRYQTMAEVRAALAMTAVPEGSHARSSDQAPSIAVLPFANMSRDADDEYFSDGLSEEIINALTGVAGLKVIARTSAFAFKGKHEDIRKIADSLGVTNVLEGSVRRSGTRLRVTTQLIHAADGGHIWSEKYDREMADVFAVQDEIAAAIASALRIKLTPDAMRRHEPNPAAHDAYLKGLHTYRIHEPAHFAETERWFKEAVALDPDWAEPRALLAERYLTVAMLGFRPLNEAMPLARAEAQKALDLRPGDAMAHATLGSIAAIHDYDWQRAEAHFREALNSVSVSPVVHGAYALYYLTSLGRFDEALAQIEQALALDPLNDWWRARRLVILTWAGRYDEAAAYAREAIATGRGGHLEQFTIATREYFADRLDAALAAAEEGVRLAPWHAGLIGIVAALRSRRGDDEGAQQALATMRGPMSASGMTTYHLYRSEVDEAITWYARDLEVRHPLVAMLAAAHPFRALHAHPRWPALAAKMNLAQ